LKKLSIAFALLGLVLATVLIAWQGAREVASVAFSLGAGGFLLILLFQLGVFLILGLAWWALLGRGGPLLYVWGRMVRDAAGNCLPFSQMGGFVFGARTLALHGVAGRNAAASTLVDVTLEFLAQMAFVLAGLLLMHEAFPESRSLVSAIVVIGLAAAGGGVFIFFQRRFMGAIDWLAARTHWAWLAREQKRLARFQEEVQLFYRAKRRLLAASLLHLIGWFAAAVGSWVTLRLLGAPISVSNGVSLEALLQASLDFAFFVPAYLGVQEAALASFGAVFGLSPSLMLAFSMVRRARDLALGIPVLLVWQGVEMRRLARTPLE
jgi:putative membrane protein